MIPNIFWRYTGLRLALLALLALALAGCRGARLPFLSTADPQETPIPALPLSGETTLRGATAAPVPSDTSAPAACIQAQASPKLAKTGFEDLPQAILDFLNAGAGPEDLETALRDGGVAASPQPALWGDLTGDGKLDVGVSVFDPDSPLIPPSGTLLVYACQADHYALLHVQRPPEGWGGAQLWHLQDLNADGRAELVAGWQSCGAHTCFQELQVLVWNREVIENRLSGSTAELPSPQVDVLDSDGDGFYHVAVTAEGVGSAGAGPPRPVTWVWAFDPEGGVWEKTADELAEPRYLIHAVIDADRAAGQGELEQASALYERVIGDPGLQSWSGTAQERDSLAAYSRYKLVVISALQGRMEDLQAQHAALQEATSDGSVGEVFLGLADAFRQAFEAGGVAAGCAAAREYAQAHEAEIASFFEFGYGNPGYNPDAICPWN